MDRSRRFQLTIRMVMAVMVLVGVVLGLVPPAVEVYRTRDLHVHTSVMVTSGAPIFAALGNPSPFWPRYLRRLRGLPWRRQPVCGPSPGRLEERCEFAHPEIVVPTANGNAYRFTRAQVRRLEQLEAKRLPAKMPPRRSRDQPPVSPVITLQ